MNDLISVNEDGGVPMFNNQDIINDIILRIYIEWKDKPVYFNFNTSIPNIANTLTINVNPTYNSSTNAIVNKIKDFEYNIIINLKVEKDNKFDIISLFRTLYHETSHICESSYKQYVDPKFDTEITKLLNYPELQIRKRNVYIRDYLSNNPDIVEWEICQLLYCICIPTEARALISGMYGELVSMCVYGNLTPKEAYVKTQAYHHWKQLIEIRDRLNSIPEYIFDNEDAELSDELPTNIDTTFSNISTLSDNTLVYVLSSTQSLFKGKITKYKLEDFIKFLRKLFNKVEKYFINHLSHCLGLFYDTEKNYKIASNDFIKNKTLISKDDIDKYKTQFKANYKPNINLSNYLGESDKYNTKHLTHKRMSGKYNRLFEGIDLKGYTPKQIEDGKKLYNYIVEAYDVAAENGETLDDELDEGIFGALVGAAAGATVGPAIMKAVCKVLGVSESGTLGSLLTSRVVLAAICGELGLRL